jgi:hypothetical protein
MKRALFSRGQCGPFVALWKRRIKGNVGGLLKDIINYWELERRIGGVMKKGGMCCIVCDFNGKMVEGIDVLVVFLFY